MKPFRSQALAALMALTALLTACGGGGGEEATPPPPPAATEVAAGQASQQRLTSAGGTLTLATAEGARFVLDVPADALAAPTDLRLVTASANARQRFHLRLEPAGLLFEGGRSATLTITLPAAMALPAGATVAYDGVPLPVQRLAEGQLRVSLAAFAGTATAAAGSERAQALAARRLADGAPACGGAPAAGDFASGGLTGSAVVELDLYGQCMVGAVQALADSGRHADAVRAALATAALLQAGGVQGNTGNGTALSFIAQAGSIACSAQRRALDAADDANVQNADDVRRLGQPVLAWQKIIEQLGAVCTQVSPTEYIDTMRSLVLRALAWYEQHLKARATSTTGADYTRAVAAAQGQRDAVRELRTLPARSGSSVDATAQEQIGQRSQDGLIAAIVQPAWQRCRDNGNFDELIRLMQLGNSPAAVKQAAQYCGTQLGARALNSAGAAIGSLQPTLGGVSAGELRASGAINVAKDGRLEISGPIAALQCPAGQAGGSESLELRLGSTVLHTLTSAPYLANTLTIDIAQALQAAGINAATFSSGTLTVTRTGSPCGGFWGDNPQPLLSLQLGTGVCAPAGNHNFCAQPLLLSNGSAVTDASPVALNERGDVLLSVPNPANANAPFYRLLHQGQLHNLPAEVTHAFVPPALSDAGTVVSQRVTAPYAPIVTPLGATQATALPMPPGQGAAGAPWETTGVVMTPAGVVFASVRNAELEPGDLSDSCAVNSGCGRIGVLRWDPPYAAYTWVDGPTLRPSSGVFVSAVNAGATVLGSAFPQPGPRTAVTWNPGRELSGELRDPLLMAIDDRGTAVYNIHDVNGVRGDGALVATATLPAVPDLNRLRSLNGAGYALVCGTGHPELVHAYDARRWSLDPAQIVDPALGWDFSNWETGSLIGVVGTCNNDERTLLRPAINRLGQWATVAPRNGTPTALVLVPRGQPLP